MQGWLTVRDVERCWDGIYERVLAFSLWTEKKKIARRGMETPDEEAGWRRRMDRSEAKRWEAVRGKR